MEYSFRKTRYGLCPETEYNSLVKVSQAKINEAKVCLFPYMLYSRSLYSVVLTQMTLDARQ